MLNFTYFQAFGVQTLSGCGAIGMGAEFLIRHLHYKTLYMSTPTWG
jgi:aspartate aminotransferase